MNEAPRSLFSPKLFGLFFLMPNLDFSPGCVSVTSSHHSDDEANDTDSDVSGSEDNNESTIFPMHQDKKEEKEKNKRLKTRQNKRQHKTKRQVKKKGNTRILMCTLLKIPYCPCTCLVWTHVPFCQLSTCDFDGRERQTNRPTRQTDSQIYRQTERQTDRSILFLRYLLCSHT